MVLNFGCNCVCVELLYRHKSNRGAETGINTYSFSRLWVNFQQMDHRAIDTQMVHLHEHLLMAADDPELQWLVTKLHQPSSTSHWKQLGRESL